MQFNCEKHPTVGTRKTLLLLDNARLHKAKVNVSYLDEQTIHVQPLLHLPQTHTHTHTHSLSLSLCQTQTHRHKLIDTHNIHSYIHLPHTHTNAAVSMQVVTGSSQSGLSVQCRHGHF